MAKTRDEHGFLWTNHKAINEMSTPVAAGIVHTKARIRTEGGRITASVHGVTLTNPEAEAGEGEWGFLRLYEWPSVDAAKEAIRKRAEPR